MRLAFPNTTKRSPTGRTVFPLLCPSSRAEAQERLRNDRVKREDPAQTGHGAQSQVFPVLSKPQPQSMLNWQSPVQPSRKLSEHR